MKSTQTNNRKTNPKLKLVIIVILVIVIGLLAVHFGSMLIEQMGNDNSNNYDYMNNHIDDNSDSDIHNSSINIQDSLKEPVIYLYPTKIEKVNVKVDYKAGFLKTVPEYSNDGWNVIAQPSGNLTNISDNKLYPYLLWEGNPDQGLKFNMTKGFVVKGSATEQFLNSELKLIGLNDSESKEFISYWLPKMKNNKYNLIHFATDEYTAKVKLAVTPKPDSLLRVLMVYKSLGSKPDAIIAAQHFNDFKRQGFTVVEWGGTRLK